MLVLSRRVDEVILVNGPCRIRIVDVRGEQVKVGIEAGGEVAAHREELVERHGELRRLHPQTVSAEREIAHT